MTGREIYNNLVLIQKDNPLIMLNVTYVSHVVAIKLSKCCIFLIAAKMIEITNKDKSSYIIIQQEDVNYSYHYDGLKDVSIYLDDVKPVNNPRNAGRKRQINLETVADLYNQGMTMQYIADDLGCSIGSVSNAVKECRREGLVKQKDKYTSNSFHYKKTW